MRLSRIAGVAVLVAVFTGAAAPAQAQLNLTSITNLENVAFDAATGVLTIGSATLTGTLNGLPFTTQITNLVLGPGHGQSCSVLDLTIEPISVSLLGLHIDTSSICLTITAQQGQGLLGDLLCGLTGAGGGILNTIGDILNGADFLSYLTTILNQALGQQGHGGGNGNGGSTVCTGECTVLNVVLGPLKLNLLGVTVKLNGCPGPVQVCVSATASEGLLGEILCGLAGGGPLNTTLQDLLSAIEGLISGLGLG